MTESARVKECEHPFFVSESCPHCRKLVSLVKRSELVAMQADRDAQAALVERMRTALERINGWPIVFPEACYAVDQQKDLQFAKSVLAATPSSALQEFKERCWQQGAEQMKLAMICEYNEARDEGCDANGAYDCALDVTAASIVAELRKQPTASQTKGEKG